MKHKPKVIIEKYKKWNYTDDSGYYIWTNRYGDIIKTEDVNGNPKHTFSRELQQDLQMYGIDVEAELTAMLSQEIAKEIDKEIIQELIKSEREETTLTRIVLFEKCRKCDLEKNGLKYWYDKNGKTIRVDDANSTLDLRQFLGRKGTTFLEAGYVYAPYIPTFLEPEIINFQDFAVTSPLISRYATKQINSDYYDAVYFPALIIKQPL